MYQRTIKRNLEFSGIGVHTGKLSHVVLKPSDFNTGIIFFKDAQRIELNINNISLSPLCTTISKNGVSIKTIEHLLSCIYALSITNIEIHIYGDEIPILDGCSHNFSKLLINEIKTQNIKRQTIDIKKIITYSSNDKFIIAIPSANLKINYYIDYGNNLPHFMFYSYKHSSDNYIKEISRARTFGYKKDVSFLKKNNLANGANLINTLVIDNNKYLSDLSYDNEPVRHKILDLLGDLSFLNKNINAEIFAYKTGHKEHLEFIEQILSHI